MFCRAREAPGCYEKGMSEALKIPPLMTVAEFVAWDAPSASRWQLVDGVPRAMAPASRSHGRIQSRANTLIDNHLGASRSPCTVVSAPGIVPRVRGADNFRVPELAVTCAPYRDEEYALTDPILIVEVLSPSNRADTWSNVWAYTTIPSLREILVLESTSIAADLLRRGPDGSWADRPIRIVEGYTVLESIGLSAPIADFYRGSRFDSGRS